MKSLILLILLLMYGLMTLAQDNTADREIKSTVKSATVFLEGAEVSRQKNIDLQPGTWQLKFNQLSSDIDAKSIQVKASGPVTVLSVSHRLNYLDKAAQNAEVEKIRLKITELAQKLEDEQTKLQIIDDQLNFMFTNQQITGPNQNNSVAALKEATIHFQTQVTQLKTDRLTISRRMTQLEKEREMYESQISGITNKRDKPTSEITVKLKVLKAAVVPVEISYWVKSAGWFPSYDIRANSILDPIELVYKANVFQNTGEDWQNISLRFSSGNPNLSGVAPALQPYYLDYYLRPPVYLNQTGNLQGTVRDQNGEPMIGANIIIPGTTIGTITDINGNYSLTLPPNTNSVDISFLGYRTATVPVSGNRADVILQEDNVALDEVVMVGYDADYSQETPVAEALQGRLAGISLSKKKEMVRDVKMEVTPQTRQTSFVFTIAEPYSVTADGKYYAVEMNRIEATANFEYFAAPKISKDAYLMAHITDWDKFNLLAGEANLFFEGTYTGKTILDPGSFTDTLTISMGRDKNITISRNKSKEYSKRQTIGSKASEIIQWNIDIRNQKSQPVNLVIADQFPVSQREEIEVTRLESTAGIVDNKSGEVKWIFTLDPGKTKNLILSYQVKYPKNRHLVIE